MMLSLDKWFKVLLKKWFAALRDERVASGIDFLAGPAYPIETPTEMSNALLLLPALFHFLPPPAPFLFVRLIGFLPRPNAFYTA